MRSVEVEVGHRIEALELWHRRRGASARRDRGAWRQDAGGWRASRKERLVGRDGLNVAILGVQRVGKRRVDKSSDGAVDVVAKDRRAEEPEPFGASRRLGGEGEDHALGRAGAARLSIRRFGDSQLDRTSTSARDIFLADSDHVPQIKVPPYGLLRRIRVIENGKALGDEEALVVYFCKVLAGVVLLKEALDNGALHCEPLITRARS